LKRIPFIQQIDRYQGHIKYCKTCQNALSNLLFVKKWSLLIGLIPFAVTQRIVYRIIGIMLYCVLYQISSNLVAEMNGGEYLKGKKVSAAQMYPF
jgi:hypothetical protein